MHSIKKITKMIDGRKQTTSIEYAVPPMEGVPQYDHPGDPKGKDTVPAWLTPGEAVIPKEAVDMFPKQVDSLIEAGRDIQDNQPVYANEGLKGLDLDFIKSLESFERTPYMSLEGKEKGLTVPDTIFYGNKYYPNQQRRLDLDNPAFHPSYMETRKLSEPIFAGAINKASKALNKLNPEVRKDLNDNQKTALVSMAYNLGEDSVALNSLIDKINNIPFNKRFKSDYIQNLIKTTGTTVKGQTQPNQGLINRRIKEADKYGTYDFQMSDLLPTNLINYGRKFLDSFSGGIDATQDKLITEKWLQEKGMNIIPGSVDSQFDAEATDNDHIQYFRYEFDQSGRPPIINTKSGQNIPNPFFGLPEYPYESFEDVKANRTIPRIAAEASNVVPEITNQILTDAQRLDKEPEFNITTDQALIPDPVIPEELPVPDFASLLNLDSNEIAKGLSIDKEKVDKKVKENIDNRDFWEKSRDKLFEILGNALDEEALMKMAINYGGSRLLGYDHTDSLSYAAGQYNAYDKEKQKQVNKFILDNADKYTPKSLEKFRLTRDQRDLDELPKGPMQGTGLGGSLFDRSTGEKIDLMKSKDGIEFITVPNSKGVPTQITLQELMTQFPNRFTKFVPDLHDNLKLTDRFVKSANDAIDFVNKTKGEDDVELGPQATSAQDLASTAVAVLRKYQQRYNFSSNEGLGFTQRLNRAIKNYYVHLNDFNNGRETNAPGDLEGFLVKQFVTFDTGLALKPTDFANTNDLNLTSLHRKVLDVTDPFGEIEDLKVHQKKVKDFYNEHKMIWSNLPSYRGYDKSLVKEGWNPMLRWMFDLVQTNNNGDLNPPDEALQLMYTLDSINIFRKSLNANDLVPVSDKVRKIIEAADKKYGS